MLWRAPLALSALRVAACGSLSSAVPHHPHSPLPPHPDPQTYDLSNPFESDEWVIFPNGFVGVTAPLAQGLDIRLGDAGAAAVRGAEVPLSHLAMAAGSAGPWGTPLRAPHNAHPRLPHPPPLPPPLAAVKSVQYGEEGVEVKSRKGKTYCAQRAVLAVPLGVAQVGAAVCPSVPPGITCCHASRPAASMR